MTIRKVTGSLLFIGFPAWMLYWIQSSNALIYTYALMGYAVLMVYLLAAE